jgi:acylphosphatase
VDRLVGTHHAAALQNVPELHGARIRSVIRRRVVVRGRVQGVFFRDSVRRLAGRLGVRGWVANRWDGAVEAVFEGEPDPVDRLVDFCRKGPRGAQVDSVDLAEEEPEGLTGFAVH